MILILIEGLYRGRDQFLSRQTLIRLSTIIIIFFYQEFAHMHTYRKVKKKKRKNRAGIYYLFRIFYYFHVSDSYKCHTRCILRLSYQNGRVKKKQFYDQVTTFSFFCASISLLLILIS